MSWGGWVDGAGVWVGKGFPKPGGGLGQRLTVDRWIRHPSPYFFWVTNPCYSKLTFFTGNSTYKGPSPGNTLWNTACVPSLSWTKRSLRWRKSAANIYMAILVESNYNVILAESVAETLGTFFEKSTYLFSHLTIFRHWVEVACSKTCGFIK